jgi:hypothetical protein
VCLDIANIKNRDVVQEQQNFTRIGNSSTRNDEYLVSFLSMPNKLVYYMSGKLQNLKSYMKFTKMATPFATG